MIRLILMMIMTEFWTKQKHNVSRLQELPVPSTLYQQMYPDFFKSSIIRSSMALIRVLAVYLSITPLPKPIHRLELLHLDSTLMQSPMTQLPKLSLALRSRAAWMQPATQSRLMI